MQVNNIQNELKKYGLNLDLVWWGIANRIKNTILINRNMIMDKEFENYLNEVLRHEISHTNGYSLHDIKIDMIEGDLFKNIKFCLKYPSGFIQFIPVSYYKKQWSIDINLIINYIMIILAILIFKKLLL